MNWKRKFVGNWGRLGMKSNLSEIYFYNKEKIAVNTLTKKNYISTENIQPNKGE